ncbi:unnamed protein product [Linum trigynum]|uniref:Uncharacterized protein n=1 Tax=Linum trigynum TaxID=586398 RepID=A0AAV2E8T0_9ROSI
MANNSVTVNQAGHYHGKDPRSVRLSEISPLLPIFFQTPPPPVGCRTIALVDTYIDRSRQVETLRAINHYLSSKSLPSLQTNQTPSSK